METWCTPFRTRNGVTRRVGARLWACPSWWRKRTRQAWRPRRPRGVGGSIAPFALGAKQPQFRRCAGATHPATLCSMVPRTAPTHTTAGRDLLRPRALRAYSTQGALGGAEGRPFLYGFVWTLATQPRVRQVQVSPPYDGPSCGMLFSPIRLVSHADPQEDVCLRRSPNRRRT